MFPQPHLGRRVCSWCSSLQQKDSHLNSGTCSASASSHHSAPLCIPTAQLKETVMELSTEVHSVQLLSSEGRVRNSAGLWVKPSTFKHWFVGDVFTDLFSTCEKLKRKTQWRKVPQCSIRHIFGIFGHCFSTILLDKSSLHLLPCTLLCKQLEAHL